jgi:hypothetical protein
VSSGRSFLRVIHSSRSRGNSYSRDVVTDVPVPLLCLAECGGRVGSTAGHLRSVAGV